MKITVKIEEEKMEIKEIVDSLYQEYGTDSNVLFGISERIIVEKIVEFVLKFEKKRAKEKYE